MIDLYVYTTVDNRVLAVITGQSITACESKAMSLNFHSDDMVGWTCADPVGFTIDASTEYFSAN